MKLSSFFEWAVGNDPRSLIIPLFSDRVDSYKSLVTMAIRQVIKGLISNEENRQIQTAVVIDELGALYAIDELLDLLAQGRKFKTCFIGATQTLSQLERVYSQTGVDTLLQTIRTKLILNCPDYRSATVLAQAIGFQERVDVVKSVHANGTATYTEQVVERYVIHPSQIQQLLPLTGYVHISEGLPVASVSIRPVTYPAKAPRRVERPSTERNHSSRPNKLSSALPNLSGSQFFICHVAQELYRLLLSVDRVKQALCDNLLDLHNDSHHVKMLLEQTQESFSGIRDEYHELLLYQLNPEQRKEFIKTMLQKIQKGIQEIGSKSME